MHDEAPTLSDDEIETVSTAEDRSAAPAARVDDGDDTGDDSGDTSDTSDTGDDSGDDSGDTADVADD
jgi:hypothetical protein